MRLKSALRRGVAAAVIAGIVVSSGIPAYAGTWDIADGDITVKAGDAEGPNNVKQGDNDFVKDEGDTVITGESKEHTVTIDTSGGNVDVTFDDLKIDASSRGYKDPTDTGKAAVSVTGSGDTTIELDGNNTLKSGDRHAALEHNKTDTSGKLTIQDVGNDGSLDATGGFRGAGIGGGEAQNGQVTITGGTITATAGSSSGRFIYGGGSGIGGGDGGTGVGGNGDVEITGGTITATGVYGAGIGGGRSADGDVTISGGTITEASGGYMAAGIGSGYQGLGTVTIEGDAVIKNAQGGEAGAGIGSGTRGNSEIIIRGDAVIENAESKENGAGIGSGQGDLYPDGDGMVIDLTVGNVTIEGNAKIENAKSGSGGSGIGGGVIGIGNVIIRGNAQIGNATGGEEGAGIGGGALGTGDVTIEGNVTIENAQGGAGAAGIGGGAETQPDTEDTRNKVSIKSTEAGSPNITAKGGGVLNNEEAPLPGAAAIGSGSVADGATEVKSDITVEGKVTIDATSGGNVAIGDSTNGETRFSGLQVGTTITRRNAKGDDVSQPGDVVREPEKPAQPTVTPTEGAEAPSNGSVEVERPVTVEGLYVTNVLGKQITHTCTQNGTTLTIRANGIVASAHLTLGMVRTLKAQGVKTLVFTTLLSRSTTVSVDALLAAEPDAPDEMAVVWTHTGPRAALTIGGADHSDLLK